MRAWLVCLGMLAAPLVAEGTTREAVDTETVLNLARGDLLYAYDQSGWHVTDAMQEQTPKALQQAMRGYIVTPDVGGYRTTFYGGEAGAHTRLYSAVWDGRATIAQQRYEASAAIPVTPEEARLIGAKEAAMAQAGEIELCSRSSPNSVVLPGARPGDAVSVYILTSSTEAGVIPLGGHFRIDVAGDKIVARRKFMNSCMTIDTRQQPGPKGAKMSAFMITHLLDPRPTEIHAFSVHYLGLPLAVGTKDGGIYMLELKEGRATASKIVPN